MPLRDGATRAGVKNIRNEPLHEPLDYGQKDLTAPPPYPLSALYTANEVAAAMEAGPEAESFVNANGSDQSKLSAAQPAESLPRPMLSPRCDRRAPLTAAIRRPAIRAERRPPLM